MPVYKFKALDNSNSVIENQIRANSIEEAKIALTDKGFVPFKIQKTINLEKVDISFSKRIKRQDIIVFCRELAMVIKSGVSLSVGLDILKKQSAKELKKAVQEINIEVQKGRTLAQAMKETELKFPELLIKMISTGEASGNLDNILENMADYYERENYITQKIKGALVYPVVLIVVAFTLLIFFSQFILPQLVELLAGQELPFITTLVINIINGVGSIYGVIGLAVIICGVFMLKQLLPYEKYRKYKDQFVLKVPIIGPVVKGIITVRFTRTLHLLLKSGLNIVNILDILKKVISNSVAEEVIESALDGVKRGEKLGAMLGLTKFFDPIIIQMISVGEETGELENILDQITNFYEKKLEAWIAKLISVIEPAFTLIIGGVIAVVILAIALPIFSMAGDLGGITGGLDVE